MYLPKGLAAVVALLFSVTLAAPAPTSAKASQAPAAASNTAIPDITTPFFQSIFHTQGVIQRDAASGTSVTDPSAPVGDTVPAVFTADTTQNQIHKCTFKDEWRDETTDGSPSIDDCQHIATNIAGGGTWTVQSDVRWHQLVQWGNCAVRVKSDYHPLAVDFRVGNGELTDIINVSTDRFGADGRVASAGGMICKDRYGLTSVDITFSLFRNPHTEARSVLPRHISAGDATSSSTTGLSPAVRAPVPVHFNQEVALKDKCSPPLFTFDAPRQDQYATVDDCRQLAKNIAGGGVWEVEAVICHWHQLVQWGDCALGVKAVCPFGSRHDSFFKVGNDDITDIITQSIERFNQSNVRVSSFGEMRCRVGLMPPPIQFHLYRIDKGSKKRQVFHPLVLDGYPISNGTNWNNTAQGMPAPNITEPCTIEPPKNDTTPAVFTPSTNSSSDGPSAESASVNMCGLSSFIDQWSAASPLIDDCLQIAYNIRNGGRWEVENTDKTQHQLVQYGTCALGVQGYDGFAFYFYVGNQDIMDLINESIHLMAQDGKVQTMGYMYCNSDIFAPPLVTWGIYSTVKK